MSIDFIKSKKIAKTKSADRRATVRYEPKSGMFYAILHNDDVHLIIEDYSKATVYYSRPANPRYDYWYKTGNVPRKPIAAKDLKRLKLYWATVCPKQKIVGSIKEKTFIPRYS